MSIVLLSRVELNVVVQMLHMRSLLNSIANVVHEYASAIVELFNALVLREWPPATGQKGSVLMRM